MKVKIWILAAVLLLGAIPMAAGAQDTSEGSTVKAYHPLITAAEGSVKVKGTQFSVWEPAEVGTLLLSGDIVKTEAGARAEIQFLSGKVQLYENSVLIIPSIGVQLRKKDVEEIIVQDGSVLFDINPLGVKREFEFRTKNVQGGVKGTLFTVTYRDQGTSVNVYEGQVVLSDVDRSGETRVNLSRGKRITVSKKSDFNDIRGFDPSTAIENYRYNIPPGLDGKGLPSDFNANPSNKGKRKRGNGKEERPDDASDSFSTTDVDNDQGEDEK